MVTKQMSNEQLAMSKVKKGDKKASLPLLFALCSLLSALCSFELSAQNSGYFLDTSGEQPRFIQRLSWQGDEYVLRYEVVIERDNPGGYQEVLRESTTALFMEVSLLPGRYRFYIIPYDYLGHLGERSDWMHIEVLRAMFPELDNSPSEYVFSDGDLVYVMDITGRNFVSGAEIYLRDYDDKHIYPFVANVNEDGSTFRLSFYKDQLLPGIYGLFVKNPGGLETSRSGISVTVLETGDLEITILSDPEMETPKKFNAFLGLAWMPLLSIYDDAGRFPDKLLSPVGAAVRFGVVSTKRGIVSLGGEFALSWCLFNGETTTHFIDPGINLLLQKWSPKETIAVTFRLGAGYSFLLNSGNAISFADSIHTNIGLSLLAFVSKNIYLEAGFDFAQWFTAPVSGNFRPSIGLGWKF
jgi:hypothetical protein